MAIIPIKLNIKIFCDEWEERKEIFGSVSWGVGPTVLANHGLLDVAHNLVRFRDYYKEWVASIRPIMTRYHRRGIMNERDANVRGYQL